MILCSLQPQPKASKLNRLCMLMRQPDVIVKLRQLQRLWIEKNQAHASTPTFVIQICALEWTFPPQILCNKQAGNSRLTWHYWCSTYLVNNDGDWLPQINFKSGKITYLGILNAFLLNTVLFLFKKILSVPNFIDCRVTLSYHLVCFMHNSACWTAQTFKSVKMPNLLIVFLWK